MDIDRPTFAALRGGVDAQHDATTLPDAAPAVGRPLQEGLAAGNAAPKVEGEERRIDVEDGEAYTREEFLAHSSGVVEWDAAGSKQRAMAERRKERAGERRKSGVTVVGPRAAV
jgi:hypothetical protein